MKSITRDHTDNATIERYGDGVAVLDMDGHLRELKYSVPLSPRVTRRASWNGVVDGLGRVQHPVGFLEDERRPDRDKPRPCNKPLSNHITDDELIADFIALGNKKAIADKYMLKYDVIKNRFNKINAKSPGAIDTRVRDEEILNLWDSGKSVVQISLLKKMDHRAIRRILNKCGVINTSFKKPD